MKIKYLLFFAVLVMVSIGVIFTLSSKQNIVVSNQGSAQNRQPASDSLSFDLPRVDDLVIKSNEELTKRFGLEDAMALTDGKNLFQPSSPQINNFQIGTKKILLVNIWAREKKAPKGYPYTPTDLKTAFDQTVVPWFRIMSFNKLILSVESTPWIDLDVRVENNNCRLSDIFPAVYRRLARLGYNLSAYNYVSWMIPPELCATVNGMNVSWAYINGRDSFIRTQFFKLPDGTVTNGSAIWIHEIGHNLGLHHANSYTCSFQDGVCANLIEYREYGNPFDIMGSGSFWYDWGPHPKQCFGPFHAQSKRDLGWIPSSDILHVTTSQQVTLKTAEDFTGLRGINIHTENGDYFIEKRQPKDFYSCQAQAWLPATLPQKFMLIHSSYYWSLDPYWQGQSTLYFSSWSTQFGMALPILSPGEVFISPDRKLVVRALADGDTVDIEIH